MKRIKASGRRYARGESPVSSGATTHIIKIGWNIAAAGADKIQPGKLNGFLICKDTLGPDNRPLIDVAAMNRLGFSETQCRQAIKDGFKADEKLLPQQLRFMLMADGKRDGEDWVYDGIFAEAYECYGKGGKFCDGDGQNAIRKQDDGSKKTIACNPYGKANVAPVDYCQFSGPGKPCRSHGRLTVCLYYLDSNGTPCPLSPDLGMQSRARFDTTSEYTDQEILEALDRAAERVRGILHGITGQLFFQKKGRRTGEGKAITGKLTFVLDEESILERERILRAEDDRMHTHAIELKTAGLPVALIDAPTVIVNSQVNNTEPDPFEAVEYANADQASESADDDPFGADNTHDPAHISVADATDNQLMAALEAHCIAVAERLADGTKPSMVLQEVAEEVDQRLAESQIDIGSIEWFAGGATPKHHAGRKAILRKICQHLESNEHPDFVIKEAVQS